MSVKQYQIDLTQPFIETAGTSDPTPIPGKASIYPKDVGGGVVEWFAMDESGNITPITNRGSVSLGSIERHTDVDLTGIADGYVLKWNSTTSAFEPAPDDSGGGGSISDEAYNSVTWDGITTVAPSKNAIRDKINSMDTLIAVNTAKVSAGGTIDVHSDVDTSGKTSGQYLRWNGSNWEAATPGGGGDLLAANNLSDVDNAATALSNLGGLPTTTFSAHTATHAPSDAEANPTQVSGGEITAGTETNLRSYSPANIVSFISQHGGSGSVSDEAYNATTWDAVTGVAPSKNAIRDKLVSMDASIASNTSKVSASGSIDTHSDVDTTTSAPSIGEVLEWDGSNWVPGVPAGGGDLLAANNLSDVASTATALSNLGGVSTTTFSSHTSVHAPSNAEANPTQVSGGEITTGTETALRSYSPADIVSFISQHGGSGSVSDEAYNVSTWDGITGTAPSKNAVRDKINSMDTLISANTAKVSASGSIDTHSDVDTTTSSPSTDDVLKWDGSNWVPGTVSGGSSVNEFLFVLPAAATMAARIPLVTGLPSGWSLATADTAGDAEFGTDPDTLIMTWDVGLGVKLAVTINVIQVTPSGPGTGQIHLDLWTSASTKTRTTGTKAAAYLSGKGVSTTKDLKVFIKLV